MATKRQKIREQLAEVSKLKPIKKPRKKRQMTDEQKAAMVDRLAKARAARGPAKNLSIAEPIRDLPLEHPLSPDKVKDWIKEQKDLIKGLGKEAKESKDKNLRQLYWETETYIFNLQRYLGDGIYRDNRYGAQKQNTIQHRCVAMAYYTDGTPKRTPGVYYPDIGDVYTNEMAIDDKINSRKNVSNKK